MKRIILLLALLAMAGRAEAYAIAWSLVASFDAELSAWDDTGAAYNSAHTSSSVWEVAAVHSDWPGPYAYAGAERTGSRAAAYATARGLGAGFDAVCTWSREFKLVGGHGSEFVTLDLAGHALSTRPGDQQGVAEWHADVDGMNAREGHYSGLFSVSFTDSWSGWLNYGQVYTAHGRTHALLASLPDDPTERWVDSYLGFTDAPAFPVPEPASRVLLALGMVPLLNRRKRGQARERGCAHGPGA